jgi:hypothetical protein
MLPSRDVLKEGRVSARGYLGYETGTLKKGEGTFLYFKKKLSIAANTS